MAFRVVLLLLLASIHMEALAKKFSTIRCGENEVYKTCGPARPDCEFQCGLDIRKILPCPKACGPPKCVCVDEFIRMPEGHCAPVDDCPDDRIRGQIAKLVEVVEEESSEEESEGWCWPNEKYNKCAPSMECELSCNHKDTPPSHCNLRSECAGRCVCVPDFVRDSSQNCISRYDCPPEISLHCPSHSHYERCGPTEDTCERTCKNKRPHSCIQALCGPPKCICNDAFLKNDMGHCVREHECDGVVTKAVTRARTYPARTTRQPYYRQTTKRPIYRPTRPAFRRTTGRPVYRPTRPAFRRTTRRPVYRPTRPAYRRTTRAYYPPTRMPSHRPTTRRPYYRPTTRRPVHRPPTRPVYRPHPTRRPPVYHRQTTRLVTRRPHYYRPTTLRRQVFRPATRRPVYRPASPLARPVYTTRRPQPIRTTPRPAPTIGSYVYFTIPPIPRRPKKKEECGFNEVYKECGPVRPDCELTCVSDKNALPCPRACGPGRCLCRTDYLRNISGHCIPHQQCPGKCSLLHLCDTVIEGYRYEEPYSRRESTVTESHVFEFLVTPPPTPKRQRVYRPTITTERKPVTAQPVCPPNEIYQACGPVRPDCELTCSNNQAFNFPCPPGCGPPKCMCQLHLLRNAFGQCVLPIQCPLFAATRAVATTRQPTTLAPYFPPAPVKHPASLDELAIVLVGGFERLELYFPHSPARNGFSEVKSKVVRFGHVATVVDNHIYVAGGDTQPEDPWEIPFALNSTEICTFTPPRCIDGPKMLEARRNPCAVVHGNHWYVFGGHSGREPSSEYANDDILDTVEYLDFALNEWKPAGFMLMRRRGCAAVVLEEYIYVIGGLGDEGVASMERHDPSKMTQANYRAVFIAEMPQPLNGLSAVVFEGSIITCGGFDSRMDVFHSMDQCYRYDASHMSWDIVSTMSHERRHFTLLSHDDFLYAVSGDDLTDWDVDHGHGKPQGLAGSERTVEKWGPNGEAGWKQLETELAKDRKSCVAVFVMV